MKRNVYLLGYIPFISVLLFAMAFSLYFYHFVKEKIIYLGLYEGLSAYISATHLNVALFVCILIVVMMVLALLKLFAEFLLRLSLLFFSKDSTGLFFIHSQTGAIFYLFGGVFSIFLSAWLAPILVLFVLSTLCFFVYILYKLGDSVSISGIIGIIFFQVFVWVAIGSSLYITVIQMINYGLKKFLDIIWKKTGVFYKRNGEMISCFCERRLFFCSV